MRKLTTLATARTATAVAASGTASHGSLSLGIALGGVGSSLVDGLNGGVGLGFALLVVTYIRGANTHGQQLGSGIYFGSGLATRSNRIATDRT